MSEKILDIKDERLSFFTPAGEVKALNGVSFTMNQGDVLGVVGESGSGKSVTAYSVMGLTAYPGKLVGGKVWFNGHEIENMKEKDFRKIRGNEVSIIFQDPMTSLNPLKTIGDQIMEAVELHQGLKGAAALRRYCCTLSRLEDLDELIAAVFEEQRKAGLDPDKYSSHKLRHTAATLMLQNGVDVRTLQEVLGHEHLNTTQIYTHVDNSELRVAAQANPLAEYIPEHNDASDK